MQQLTVRLLHRPLPFGGPPAAASVWGARWPSIRRSLHCTRCSSAAQTLTQDPQSQKSSALPADAGHGAMDAAVLETIKHIHATPYKAVFYITGGSMQAVSWILTTPGASRTVLEARVPYAEAAMVDALGHPAETYACVETADDLAKAAYQQAANLASLGTAILGVGCTCALATDRQKRGDHKAFVATHNGTTSRTFSVQLCKGKRDRLQEDRVASCLLVSAVAQACGLPAARQLDLGLLRGEERLQEDTTELSDPLEELLAGNVRCVEFSGGRTVVDAPRRGRVLMSGSFNPLHDGHKGMLRAGVAMRSVGLRAGSVEGLFELSASNADKGQLPIDELRQRVRQFTEQGLPVVVTQEPLYPLKARLFPGSTFVIGYDTAVRLVDSKYYGGDDAALLQVAAMKSAGCTVLVAGRTDGEGRFMRLQDMAMPKLMQEQALFEPISEEAFRMDISSTLLRSRSQTDDTEC